MTGLFIEIGRFRSYHPLSGLPLPSGVQSLVRPWARVDNTSQGHGYFRVSTPVGQGVFRENAQEKRWGMGDGS